MTSYNAIHQRLNRERGPASAHHCPTCGFWAGTWAYDHTDPDELRDTRGRAYSKDLARYLPLCSRCHYRFDAPYCADPRRLKSAQTFPRPNAQTIAHAKRLGWWPPPPRPEYVPSRATQTADADSSE